MYETFHPRVRAKQTEYLYVAALYLIGFLSLLGHHSVGRRVSGATSGASARHRAAVRRTAASAAGRRRRTAADSAQSEELLDGVKVCPVLLAQRADQRPDVLRTDDPLCRDLRPLESLHRRLGSRSELLRQAEGLMR